MDWLCFVPAVRHHQKPAVPKTKNERLVLIKKPFRNVAADGLPSAAGINKTDITSPQPTENPPDDFVSGYGFDQRHRRTFRQLFRFKKLHRIEAGINAILFEECIMFAVLDDASFIDHINNIGIHHRRKAMGNHQRRPAFH